MPLFELSNVNPQRLSLVKRGANGKTFFLRKADESESDAHAEALPERPFLVKGDWSTVYCVVAEPGAVENGGVGAPAGTQDRWTATEIEKACHAFAANGGKINLNHEGDAGYGTLVENAIAKSTFTVTAPDGAKHTIKKGSWYVAIRPSDALRQGIEKGEITGVSLEGSGVRTLISKAEAAMEELATAVELHKSNEHWAGAVELFGEFGAAALFDAIAKAAPGPDLDRSPKKNWVDRVGGFKKSSWIYRAAKWLANTKGFAIGHAIATAINAAKKGCATGDLNWPGAQSVNMGSRAQMCAAVADWERMKASAGGGKRHVAKGDAATATYETATSVSAVLDTLDNVNPVVKLLRRIAKESGVPDAEIDAALAEDADIAKAMPTFDELMAERDLEKTLPESFSVLRQVVWQAFNPRDDDEKRDPKDVIGKSLDQFKTRVLALADRVPVAKAEGGDEAVAELLRKELGEPPEATNENRGTLGPNDEPGGDTVTDDERKSIVKEASDAAVEAITGKLPEALGAALTKALPTALEPVTERITKLEGGNPNPSPEAPANGTLDADTRAKVMKAAKEAGLTDEQIAKAFPEPAAATEPSGADAELRKQVDDALIAAATAVQSVQKLAQGQSTQDGGTDVVVAKAEGDHDPTFAALFGSGL